MLPELIAQIVSTVNNIDIDKMTVIDAGGDGQALPGIAKQLPSSVIAIAEQIETATGVDIMGPLRDRMTPAGLNGDAAEQLTAQVQEAAGDSNALTTGSASEAPQIQVPTEVESDPV